MQPANKSRYSDPGRTCGRIPHHHREAELLIKRSARELSVMLCRRHRQSNELFDPVPGDAGRLSGFSWRMIFSENRYPLFGIMR
jgi:hypothetical protein